MEPNIPSVAKIISPKTGRLITVNGDAYRKLLRDGYTEEELLKKSVNKRLLPPPKLPVKIEVNQDYRTGFTGKFDTDKYLIDQLDLKDLLRFYQTDKYIKSLVDNDKRLKELIRLLNQSSIYNPEKQSFDFKEDKIIDYTLKLLEDRKTNEAMKIVDFYEPKDKLYIDIYNAADEYFYGRLFYEIMESYLIDLPYIFEDYFIIAPNDVDWIFLEDALETPLGNWNYPDILKLITKLLKSAEVTSKNKAFDEIVSIWNLWYDSLKELMIEEGTEADLKLFNDVLKLIDHHYKK
jgi:hypothetical protein